MDLSSIGRNVCKYRLEKHLRQEDLAERAGLSNNYVGALERGEKRPSLSCFIKLVNALEVSADMLLTDLTQSDYKGRESALAEELADLSGPERQEICDVIEVMIRHAKQRKL